MKNKNTDLGKNIAFGMLFGVVIGILSKNFGLGIGLGLLFGVVRTNYFSSQNKD